jgi:hypothetical protein
MRVVVGLDSPQNTSNVQVETQSDEYDRESAEDGSNDESSGNDGGEHIEQPKNHSEGDDGGRSQSGGKFNKSFEDDDDADNNTEIGRSDILQSLVISDEDDGVAYVPSYEFHAVNLKDPILGL